MVIAPIQNLRDDDTKRFKIVKVDKTHLQLQNTGSISLRDGKGENKVVTAGKAPQYRTTTTTTTTSLFSQK